MKINNLWPYYRFNNQMQLLHVAMDLYRYLRVGSMPTGYHHILVACMPKSGSTYLSNILSNLPKIERTDLVPGYSRREQEMDTALLLLNNRKNYVAQHHVRYSEVTKNLISIFAIKPIVLVRNIFDIVISFRDHLRMEGTDASMAYIRPEMTKWDDARLECFIAKMVVPWYFNFYISWLECPEKELVNYTELTADPMKVLKNISSRFGLGYSSEQLNNAILMSDNAGKSRINIGKSGRGNGLSENARLNIIEMASYYEEVDFSPIGILVQK